MIHGRSTGPATTDDPAAPPPPAEPFTGAPVLDPALMRARAARERLMRAAFLVGLARDAGEWWAELAPLTKLERRAVHRAIADHRAGRTAEVA